MTMPTRLPRTDIFAQLEAMKANDAPWRTGRTFAYVYDAGPDVEAVAKEPIAST